MRRIRLVAAILAILTALIDGLFSLDHDVGAAVLASTAVAAVCLGIVAPFDALNPPARKRIFAACFAFFVAIGTAVGLAIMTAAQPAAIIALGGLTVSGLVLTIWSFRTRNRRKRAGWSNYYDM